MESIVFHKPVSDNTNSAQNLAFSLAKKIGFPTGVSIEGHFQNLTKTAS